MKRSITWPPVVRAGRLAMTSDPEDATVAEPDLELRQTVALAMLPGSSANPWNEQQGIGVADSTWSPTSARGRAVIRKRLEEAFSRLELAHRARLVEVVFGSVVDGRWEAKITYENLEAGMRQQMEVSGGNA